MKLLLYFLLLISTCFSSLSALDQSPKKYNLIADLPDIYVTSKSEEIGATWSNGSVWDKPLIEQVYSILKNLDRSFVFIDVGAQTGCFTLLSKYFPHSRWYAFEPIKEAADELKKNLLLNDVRNVTVYPLCISDREESRYLKLPKDSHWGLATLGNQLVRFKEYEEREVKCIRLDDFVESNHIQKVDFIKIDTEGWELFVLNGGKSMIKNNRPLILMEFNKDNMRQSGVNAADIFQILKEMDYKWTAISNDDLLCRPSP